MLSLQIVFGGAPAVLGRLAKALAQLLQLRLALPHGVAALPRAVDELPQLSPPALLPSHAMARPVGLADLDSADPLSCRSCHLVAEDHASEHQHA